MPESEREKLRSFILAEQLAKANAEAERLRASVNEDERQLCYLSCWLEERFRVNSNAVICDLPSPPAQTLARVIVQTVDAEFEQLRDQLAAIRRHWQEGIEELNTPWRLRMAELVGDTEGLREAAQAAGGKDGK